MIEGCAINTTIACSVTIISLNLLSKGILFFFHILFALLAYFKQLPEAKRLSKWWLS